MQSIAKIIMALIRYEFGEELSQETKNLITGQNLPRLFELSKRHDLAHLVADALLKNQLLPEGTIANKRFSHERNMAVYRYEQIKYEFDSICKLLEDEKINFVPLKGSVLRKLYPEPWMRTSCDIDIYIKSEDLDKTIDLLVQKLQYKFDFKRMHDANLTAPSGVQLELRYNPNSVNDKTKPIVLKALSDVVNQEDYNKKLTNEAFYFYHIEHMAVHFAIGGCGVRFFLDAWILNKNLQFNQTKKQEYLNDSGLEAFENAVLLTSEYWFGSGEKTQLVKDIEKFVLYSGLYGRMENRVAIERKSKSKIKFLLSRIFLPYSVIKLRYPILQKCPILLPFYQVKRWFNLFNKSRREKSVNELREATSGDTQKQKEVEKLLNDLNL